MCVCVYVIDTQSTKVLAWPSFKLVENMNGKNAKKETQRQETSRQMTSVPLSS